MRRARGRQARRGRGRPRRAERGAASSPQRRTERNFRSHRRPHFTGSNYSGSRGREGAGAGPGRGGKLRAAQPDAGQPRPRALPLALVAFGRGAASRLARRARLSRGRGGRRGGARASVGQVRLTRIARCTWFEVCNLSAPHDPSLPAQRGVSCLPAPSRRRGAHPPLRAPPGASAPTSPEGPLRGSHRLQKVKYGRQENRNGMEGRDYFPPRAEEYISQFEWVYTKRKLMERN